MFKNSKLDNMDLVSCTCQNFVMNSSSMTNMNFIKCALINFSRAINCIIDKIRYTETIPNWELLIDTNIGEENYN